MLGDDVTVVQMCGMCNTEIGTFTVKKDNLMLKSSAQVWCPKCEANTPEVRDVAGRLDAIRAEIESYPRGKPAQPRDGGAR